jgi:steroid delta-isomerase-like uncharacterized protein
MAQPLASLICDANAVLITNGNLDAIERFFSPEYVVNVTGQRIAGGHDIVRKVLSSILKSFPDIQVEINVLLESEDRIAWLRTLKGTHKVAFKGFPGSGQEIMWCDMVTSQIQDGKIVQEWVVTDLAERLLLSRKK